MLNHFVFVEAVQIQRKTTTVTLMTYLSLV